MRRGMLTLGLFMAVLGFSLFARTATIVIDDDAIGLAGDSPFALSGIGDDTEDYIQQISNLHAPSDIGTHSVFTDLQDYGSNYDQMTEGNTGTSGFDLEDFVDQQSGLHAPTDVGTHSDFTEMQDLDGAFDTLTEGDTGTPGVDEYNYVDGLSGTAVWTTVGTSPYLDAQDQPTNYIHTASNALVSQWYTFAATSGTSGTFTVTMSVYWQCVTGGNSYPEWELDWTNDGTADASGSFTTHTAWQWDTTTTISGLDTATEINDCRVRITHNKGSGGPDQVNIDAVRLYIYQAPSPNYDLDLEVGWTAADYDETNEYLCIYGGSQAAEALRVDVWDGSQWQNLITDVAAGWNNMSVSSYLSGTAFEIRFTDTSDDSTAQDAWQIEGVLLHVWTVGSDNYELDLELGWTSADYDETNEELCIYPVTGGGWPAEDIKVDVWNGAWTNVISDLAPDQWNNVSISSYLTSSAFEIRFVGGTETGDTTQDTWEMDTVLIHVWTLSYAPINDQAPTLDNPTDMDNMYAQYAEYQVTAYVSDQNGFGDIDYLEIALWDNTRTTEYCRFRYDEDTNTFTKEYDAGTYVSLNTGSSTATESGNDIDATFYFTVDWDFPDSTDLDVRAHVVDTQTESATTWYEVNWDIETRLDYSVLPAISDGTGTLDRGDLDGAFTITGTVIYYGSGNVFPASAAVDVWVSSSDYGTSVGPWSDLTLTSGQFSLTCYADDEVGLDTYTLIVVEEGSGAGGADLYYATSATDTYIADQLVVSISDPIDQRINVGANATGITVSAIYDYDDSAFDGTLTLNDTTFVYSDFGRRGYNVSSASGGVHGVSLIGVNDAAYCIWDSLTITITDPPDQRININTNATGIYVSAIYDYDGAAFDGTLKLNYTDFNNDTAQILWYTVESANGGVHDISAIRSNDVTYCIWDSLTITITDFSDQRINIGTAAVGISVTAVYDYDGTVFDGTLVLNSTDFVYATPQIQWYTVESVSGGAYEISAISTNDVTYCIWDLIEVQTTVADDTRVNLGDNVEIRVTLSLAYDGSFLGSGDSVTLNGTSMTWDAGNGWFELIVSKSSVGLWRFFVNSSSEATFGITILNVNGLSASVVWDEIVVQTTVADDAHINVGSDAEIRVTLYLAYDSAYLSAGDTVVLNGLVMSWDSGNSWFELAVSQSSVGLWTYFVNSSSETSYGITSLSMSVPSASVIWDQIVVQTTAADDTRVNVGDNVEIRVTLYLAYDTAYLGTGDTVVLNESIMTWDSGNSWFELSVSASSVGLWAFFVNSSSDATYGITSLDLSIPSASVVWDRIVVQTTAADDTRVNVGDSVEIRVTAYLAYDNTFLGLGDSVTLNDSAMTYDAGNSWFELSVSASSVGLWTFFANSSADATYGITDLDVAIPSVSVIWDMLVVQTTVVDDSRIDVGTSAEIRVTIWRGYDSTYLGAGDSVTLNGTVMTWDSGNAWFELSVSQSSVGLWTFFVNSSICSTYGITLLDPNGRSVSVVWDEIVVQTTAADDTRINVGENAEVRVTLYLAYDNTFLGLGDSVTLNDSAMTYDAGNSWFELAVSSASVGLWTFFVNSSAEATYGITSLNVSVHSVSVIWDQIVVQSTTVDDSHVDVNTPAEVRVTLWLAYDHEYLGIGDSVNLNGVAMTWDAVSSWWDYAPSQSSVGLWAYFVNSSAESTYGITSLDGSGLYVEVIWDQIVVETTIADDARANVGDSVEIRVTLYLAYDSAYLGMTDGVTLNDTSMAYDSVNAWFELTVSQGSVGSWTYFVNSTSDSAYGITSFDLNSQDVAIIWDRIQVQSYSVSDSRTDINEAVNIDVTLYYEFDGTPVTDGTVDINGVSATHQASGVWRAVDSESTVTENLYDSVSVLGNTYAITAIDQNGQNITVIWDQLVVTIDVDNASPTNGIQANFSLTVIFDYDDGACTTYQLVVYRNGTWWHSFTDSNKSAFVDTNSDVAYTYTVLLVTSEGTYSITAFTSNSRQVIWSLAPNSAPANDAAPVLANPDDSDNLYARYRYYLITTNVSDADGYADILYVELSLYDDARTSAVWTVRFTVSGSSFSVQTGPSYISLGACSVTMAGNDIDITWSIKVDWDHADLSNVDMRQYVYDGTVGVEDFYESNWDVETRFEIVGLTIDDGSGTSNRGPLDGAFTVSGTVIYYGSVDDYALSNETDIWVSSDAYGTNVGPWGNLTFASGQFTLIAYAANQVILANLTIKAVEESAGSGGTSLLESITQSSYISDRIQVQVYSAADDRINVGDTATVEVELLYEYDFSYVTDGTVEVNGLSATHQSNGIWQFTDSKGSVQLVTYDAVAYSGGAHGLTQVNQNAMTQDVIWDQIVVQSTAADDTRANIGDDVEIRVTLWLAYDNSFLGLGDSVTLNDTSMLWDSGNSWFELIVSKSGVGLWTFFVNSSTEATYEITGLDTAGLNVSIIWDQIVVQTTTVDDARLDVNTPAEVRVTLWLAYDHEYLGAGDSVNLDGVAMTWDSVNSWWDYAPSQSSVGMWAYFVNSTSESTYDISALDLNGRFVEIVWDEIVVETTVADDTRVNVGDDVEIRVTLYLVYDDTYLGAADSVKLNGTLMTYDAGNSWFELTVSKATVGLLIYFVNSTTDSTYGIAALDPNPPSVSVIWDRLVVQTTSVTDSRIDISTDAEVHVTIWHEYDSTYLGSGDSVTLDGTAMSWDAGNSWFEITVSQSSVGAWTYFVNSSVSTGHGISLLYLNGNSVVIVWDQIQVQSSSVSDSRVNIGDSVDLDVTLISLYDSSALTNGLVSINGIVASHQGGGTWRITVSNSSVWSVVFDTVSCSGNTYGISAVDQNSFSRTIIWDRLVILIGVDDPSLVNGVQANFTITVTFDYDDSVCTTYRVVVTRNGTWWHSFTDSNTSLFVDVGTDTAYEYTVSMVTSESSYGIVVFTVNTRLAVWSTAPNEVPTITAAAVLLNPDDTDYMYARYRYYIITTNVSDTNGYQDIAYIELSLIADDNTTLLWTIRYTRATGVFSVEIGGTYLTISTSSYAVSAGDVLEVVWMIKIEWVHPDVSGCYAEQYVTDGIDSDADSHLAGWNVETRVDYAVTPFLSDNRGDVNTTDLAAQGSVVYLGSGIFPLANETDIWVIHDVSGEWSGDLSTGAFTIASISSSLSVRLNTYTFKVVAEGAGSGGSDLFSGTSATDTFITDRVEIYQAGTVDDRINVNANGEVWWRARYVYDASDITTGLAIQVSGPYTLAWSSVDSRWYWSGSRASVQQVIFDVTSVVESTYDIANYTVLTAAQSVIWDGIVVTITNPLDQRIDVGVNATGVFVSAVYAFDSAPFDGSLDLNNSLFVYDTPQRQGYAASSVSGGTHQITLILTNDFTWVIWDRVRVVSITAVEVYFDPDELATVSVTLQYEYDGALVVAGTFSIAGESLIHVGSGRWEASITRSAYESLLLDDLSICNATLHEITEYNMDGNSLTLYWDRLEFYDVSLSDARVNLGESITISWSVRLENAGIPIAAGITAQMTGSVDLLPSGGFLIASYSESSVGSSVFGVVSASLGGIDVFVQSASDVTLIWDRVRVESTTASIDSLSTQESVEIRVTLVYEYDTTPVTDGTVRLTDGSTVYTMTYSAGGYWSASVSKTTAGTYAFTVDSLDNNAFDITTVNLNGQSVVVEFTPVQGAGLPIQIIALTAVVGVVAIGGGAVAMRRRKPTDDAGLGFDIEPDDLGVTEPVSPSEEELASMDSLEDVEAVLAPEVEEDLTLDEPSEAPAIEEAPVGEEIEPEETESASVGTEEELEEAAPIEEAPPEESSLEPSEEITPEPSLEPEPEVVEEPLDESETIVEPETELLDEAELLEEPLLEPEMESEVEISEGPEIAEVPSAELEGEIGEELLPLTDLEPEPEVVPEIEAVTEEIEEPEVTPERPMTKKELIDSMPHEVRKAIPAADLQKLSKKEIESLVKSYVPPDEVPSEVGDLPVVEEPKIPATPAVSLSELSKKELIELLPDDIKAAVSPGELKRLSKQELISLLESFLGPDSKS